MVNGVHCVLYSNNPQDDRAFFRDVLKLSNVDVGDGWLIFALPPAELAVHPSDRPTQCGGALPYVRWSCRYH